MNYDEFIDDMIIVTDLQKYTGKTFEFHNSGMTIPGPCTHGRVYCYLQIEDGFYISSGPCQSVSDAACSAFERWLSL